MPVATPGVATGWICHVGFLALCGNIHIRWRTQMAAPHDTRRTTHVCRTSLTRRLDGDSCHWSAIAFAWGGGIASPPPPKKPQLIWIILCAALVFFMQAGFSRWNPAWCAPNSINVSLKNFWRPDFFDDHFLCWVLPMFGTSGNGWIGLEGFFLEGKSSPTTTRIYFSGGVRWHGRHCVGRDG